MEVRLKSSRVVDRGDHFERQRVGDVVDLPEREAERLIAAGRAVPPEQPVRVPSRQRISRLRKPEPGTTPPQPPNESSASHDERTDGDTKDGSSWATLPLSALDGRVANKLIEALAAAGYTNLAEVDEVEDLTQTKGLGAKSTEVIKLAIAAIRDEHDE